jgi:type VI secretion system secreted protein Hcp
MSAEEASRIARAVQRVRNSKRALQVALPTAAALGAGAAIAAGAVPGSDGTITGCYAGPNGATIVYPFSDGINTVTDPPGALRVIDPSLPHTFTLPTGGQLPNPAAVCNGKEEETQITWNQKGPQGPPGPQGPAGAQGTAGESGLPGETNFGFDNASGNMFLKLDGIKGESTDSKHKGDIEIESFQWGVGRGIGSATGGAGAGKTSFQTFKITKTLDKSSPLLLGAATSGKHIKEADLLFAHKAGGKQTDYLEIKLENVLISSVQDGGSAKGAPQENVTFSFQKAEEIYLGANGKSQGKVNINFAANKAV